MYLLCMKYNYAYKINVLHSFTWHEAENFLESLSGSHKQLYHNVKFEHNAGTTSQGRDDVVARLRAGSLAFLLRQVNALTHQTYTLADLCLLDNHPSNKTVVTETSTEFCIAPFSVPKGILIFSVIFDASVNLHWI